MAGPYAKHRGWFYEEGDNPPTTRRLSARFNGTEVFDFDANDLAIAVATTIAEAAGNLTAKGFATSDGGTVTQATNITTGVTLNTMSGQITTVTGPSIAAAAEATFTVTNSNVAVTDVICVNVVNQFTDGLVIAEVTDIGAGTFDITLSNVSAAAVSAGAAVLSFVVLKGSST